MILRIIFAIASFILFMMELTFRMSIALVVMYVLATETDISYWMAQIIGLGSVVWILKWAFNSVGTDAMEVEEINE